ncbi:MAG: glutamate--cysteine ligase [Pseudomonadota bacterium]|nr:glutamate--cysteine ligase [Pseudomonadota bacterium]
MTLSNTSTTSLSEFDDGISAITGNPGLKLLRRGIEKESLRISSTGTLSPSPHPATLGSALRHPFITTDFSEAQMELITGVSQSADDCIDELTDIHRVIYEEIGDELLWVASMPCILDNDTDIPIGQYGSSNIGRVKTVYRNGLGHRYGRLMQTISGIHYNFSLPKTLWPAIADAKRQHLDQAFQDQCYFHLIRNFRRYSWLLIYLFGASPAVCTSFIRNREHSLKAFDEQSLYLPEATSLRMGPLGYQSGAQSDLHVSYNSLERYAQTMIKALIRPFPAYEAIGVEVDGHYRQLNTSLLQIENEFYGSIRPKRRIQPGERPINALRTRGVEYVEVRCLDLNPFLEIGIDADTLRFLDVFLLVCLLLPSPEDTADESNEILRNQLSTVREGRDPNVALASSGKARNFRQWATELLDMAERVASTIDAVSGTALHRGTVESQRHKVTDVTLTPSAQVLQAMSDQQVSFFHLTMSLSETHRQVFSDEPTSPELLKRFASLAENSLRDQLAQEAADTQTFEEFLESYLRLDLD